MAAQVTASDPEAAKDFVSPVVRRLLEKRLVKFSRCLSAAAICQSGTDEDVHRLRVASRRVVSALDVCRAMVPRKDGQRLSKRARTARSMGGEARDLDVLLGRLLSSEPAVPHDVRSEIVQAVVARRAIAQVAIVDYYRSQKKDKLDRRIQKLLGKVRWSASEPEPQLLEWAAAARQSRITAFQRRAEADISSLAALHKLRIAGKNLRYALELLRDGGAGEEAVDLLRTLEQVQERLGRINDSRAAASAYRKFTSRVGPAAAAVLEELADAADQTGAQQATAFRHWWQSDDGLRLRSTVGRYADAAEGQ